MVDLSDANVTNDVAPWIGAMMGLGIGAIVSSTLAVIAVLVKWCKEGD